MWLRDNHCLRHSDPISDQCSAPTTSIPRLDTKDISSTLVVSLCLVSLKIINHVCNPVYYFYAIDGRSPTIWELFLLSPALYIVTKRYEICLLVCEEVEQAYVRSAFRLYRKCHFRPLGPTLTSQTRFNLGGIICYWNYGQMVADRAMQALYWEVVVWLSIGATLL